MPRTCSAPDCSKPVHSHDLCSMHVSRLRRTGHLGVTVLRGDGRMEERYWQKVDRSGGPDACWPWTAGISPDGYGIFNRTPVGNLAHRYGWFLAHGEMPDGVLLDHTCHDPATCKAGRACPHRRCQNPAHLVVATAAENGSTARRWAPAADRTHCIHGHPYDEANTLWSVHRATGRHYRQCRACARDRYHARKARRDRT